MKYFGILFVPYRSAIMNLGYEVSLSHVAPNTMKTSAPNKVIWDILRQWHKQINGTQMKPGTPGFNILSKSIETANIDLQIRNDANPLSREQKFLRYQVNPTRNWGPGVRDSVNSSAVLEKRLKNQGRRKRDRKDEDKVLVEQEGGDHSPVAKSPKSTLPSSP